MKTLRGRLTAFVATGVGIVLIAGEADLYFKTKNLLVSVFDQTLDEKVSMLTSFSSDDLQGVTFDFTEQDLVEFRAGPDAEFYQIWSPGGDVHAKSESLGKGSLPMSGEEKHSFRNVDLPNGRSGRAILVRLANTDHQPDFRITLARDRTLLDKSLHRVLIESALRVITTVAGVIIATIFAIRLGLRQIVQLAHEARTLDVEASDNAFSSQNIPAELQPIVAQLNGLLERMRRVLERERRFSSHAAHELLTPIAELRALADVESSINPDSNLALDALAIAQQMEALVETLLQLARSQSEIPLPLDEDIVLADLLNEIWAKFKGDALAKKLESSFDWSHPIRIRTNKAALQSIIENLIKNAVSHTRPEGRLESSLKAIGGSFVFQIGNTDTTLTPSDFEHLFEPLWRKDPARTSGQNSGLGLTVSKSLAKRLGLQLNPRKPRSDWFEIQICVARNENQSPSPTSGLF
ncbi:MAG: HAMP domain-containing histidine kinase [Verrucomicrobiae bacterium]|nr:HAMP domain-containing histidine kinase [Verrucomicrobiae bacterium]